MNKVFLGIVLAVCILGMLLVMLNDRLGRKSTPVASLPVTEQPDTRASEMEAAARELEIANAAEALAPPIVEEHPAYKAEEPAAPMESPSLSPTSPEPVPAYAAPAEISEPRLPVTPPVEPVPQEPQAKPAPAPARTAPVAEPVRQDPRPAQQPAATQAPAQAVKGARVINRFVIYSRERGATVRIGGAGKLDYSSMTLTNPDRVVVDLPGNWKFPANPGVPKNDLVSAVRVGQSGDKTRVVIDLKMPARKVVLVPFKAGDGVDVRVDR
ncbi:MAG: AMIN domain-containing protein [Desulfovibrio sp.]|nr:AMIN domain-containing protein [Desulfovibrio sp.]